MRKSNCLPSEPLFKPAVILHGGAGNIHRSRLPPELWARYHASLLTYLRSTNALLNSDAAGEGSALDAVVHAVSLMEDDELFNCGRGSVFTSSGSIEMEASVMVTSVLNRDDLEGGTKRGAGVMLVKNVRHPIRLARELLLRTGYDGADDGGSMHSQLSGPYVEELAKEWGLEFKPDEWFWTKKRWDEHKRGLEKGGKRTGVESLATMDAEELYMSQGTVGCVCLDRWGNLAVATSTGGLTNKAPGRIGDTLTLGAGFWAEAWDICRDVYPSKPGSHAINKYRTGSRGMVYSRTLPFDAEFTRPIPPRNDTLDSCGVLADCFIPDPSPPKYTPHTTISTEYPIEKQNIPPSPLPKYRFTRHAVALSGTGNGDSFLRIAGARTAAAMSRFSAPYRLLPLSEAVTAVAGPGGELQRSAGSRWGLTGEGLGGIIGIQAQLEAVVNEEPERGRSLGRGEVVFDFNCPGMFRAWIEEGPGEKDIERVMVFRDEYV